MTQLRVERLRLSCDRRDLQTIFLCALVGSMTGALYARMGSPRVLEGELCFRAQPFPLSALRLSLFPVLLAAALLFRSRFLFRLLFFWKGFAGACVFCVAAASELGQLRCLPPGLLLEMLLPLPAFFLLGAVWYSQTRAERWSLLPILSALLSVFSGSLLARLLF